MTPGTEDTTVAASLATMSQQIVGLTQTVEHLREDLRAQSETYVRQDVYATRAEAIDREIKGLHKTDDDLALSIKAAVERVERAIEARRVPWTAVASLVIAGLAFWRALTGGL